MLFWSMLFSVIILVSRMSLFIRLNVDIVVVLVIIDELLNSSMIVTLVLIVYSVLFPLKYIHLRYMSMLPVYPSFVLKLLFMADGCCAGSVNDSVLPSMSR